jgi:hypothetical protein
MYYIGLDIHKKTISYCVKDQSGQICVEGIIPATRGDLDRWMSGLPQPWTAAMEATMFTGWIYDHLVPHAPVKVAHPLMLRAIAAAKKRSTATLDGGDGSNYVHRLDLRSSGAACASEGGPSADVACHRRSQEEKRSDRCQ